MEFKRVLGLGGALLLALCVACGGGGSTDTGTDTGSSTPADSGGSGGDTGGGGTGGGGDSGNSGQPLPDTLTINSTRPRLSLTATHLAKLQAAYTADTPQWQRFMDNGVTPYLSAGPSWGWPDGQAANLALAWQVTGKTEYCHRAVELAMDFVQTNPGPDWYTSSDAWRGSAGTLARVFDWTQACMSASQRQVLGDSLAAGVQEYWVYDKGYPDGTWRDAWVASSNPFGGATPCCALHNHDAGQNAGVLMAAIALDGYWGQAGTVANQVYQHFRNVLQRPYFSPHGLSAGGMMGESPEYSPETWFLWTEYFQALRTGTNADLLPHITWFPDVVDQFLADISPTSHDNGDATCNGGYAQYEPFTMSDVQQTGFHRRFSHEHRYVASIFSYVMRQQGDSQRAAYLQYWLNRVQPCFLSFKFANGNMYWIDMLWNDPSQPEQDWRSVARTPLDRYVPGRGTLFMRSDWGPDATWVHFGNMWNHGNHGHGGGGQFQIYRKGEYLTSHVEGWGVDYYATDLHSVLSINGHGSVNTIGDAEPFSASLTRVHAATTSDADPEYSYARADLTANYRTLYLPDVDLYQRDFVYFRPDSFVVFDHVKLPGAGTTTWRLIHGGMQTDSVAAPTASGNRVTQVINGQVLYATLLEPSSPSFDIAATALNGYRTEVRQTGAAEYRFLAVLQAADQGGTPYTATRVEGTNLLGARFNDGTDRIVATALDDSGSGPYSLDFSGAPRVLLVGLAPGGDYTLVRRSDGVDLQAAAGAGDIQADAAGTVLISP